MASIESHALLGAPPGYAYIRYGHSAEITTMKSAKANFISTEMGNLHSEICCYAILYLYYFKSLFNFEILVLICLYVCAQKGTRNLWFSTN